MFPQLSGLGSSGLSHTFAIEGKAQAGEFLRDPELRSRLLTITTAVAERLASPTPPSLVALMGSDTDVRKLVSSLTLFGSVARKLHADEGIEVYREMATVADAVLVVAASQGYPPCAYTLECLRESA